MTRIKHPNFGGAIGQLTIKKKNHESIKRKSNINFFNFHVFLGKLWSS